MTKDEADCLLERVEEGRSTLWDLEAAGAPWMRVRAVGQWLDGLEQLIQDLRRQSDE
jgi:hypothetical protein